MDYHCYNFEDDKSGAAIEQAQESEVHDLKLLEDTLATKNNEELKEEMRSGL